MKAEDDFEIRRLCSDHTVMQTATSEDTICLCVQSKERWGQWTTIWWKCPLSVPMRWKRVQPGDLSWREMATLSLKECSLSLRSRWQGWWPITFGVCVKNGFSAAEKSQEADHANHRGLVWEWPVIVVIIIVIFIILLNLRQLVWEWLEGLGSGLVRDKPETWIDSAWPGGQNF